MTTSALHDDEPNMDEITTPLEQNNENQINKKSSNEELWDLLNYSKARLATGTTPKISLVKNTPKDVADSLARGYNHSMSHVNDDEKNQYGDNHDEEEEEEDDDEAEEEEDYASENEKYKSHMDVLTIPRNDPSIKIQDENINDGLVPSDKNDDEHANTNEINTVTTVGDISGGKETNVVSDSGLDFNSQHSDSSFSSSSSFRNDESDHYIDEYDEGDDDDDDDDISSDETDPNDGDDDDEEEDDDEMINQAEIAASRARALAALARTRELYGQLEDSDSEDDIDYYKVSTETNAAANTVTTGTAPHPVSGKTQPPRLLPNITAPTPNKKTVRARPTLTEKQLLKSMAMAEEEALKGASEFSTEQNVSLLDKMSTPKSKDIMMYNKGKRGWGGSGGKQRRSPQLKNNSSSNKSRDLKVSSEIKKGWQRAQVLWNDSKKKAGQVMKDIKNNVAKVERKQNISISRAQYDLPANAIGTATSSSPRGNEEPVIKKESPLKKIADTISMVEKMNDKKYGHEIEFV